MLGPLGCLFVCLFVATKRVEEGCIHVWNSASEMQEVSEPSFQVTQETLCYSKSDL